MKRKKDEDNWERARLERMAFTVRIFEAMRSRRARSRLSSTVMIGNSTQQTVISTTNDVSMAEGGFRRVLSLWDLVIFGLAFSGPTAPYWMYGIASVKSAGYPRRGSALAMVAMCYTALSYGRMATAFPEAGSTYTYTAKALRPSVGFFAGWALMLDYILIPMLSVIFVGLTASKDWPDVPYWAWALVAAAGITAINLG